MGIYEKEQDHKEIELYASTQTDLGEAYADKVSVKHAFVLEDGTQWILFPFGDTWYQIGSETTIEAAEMPPDPAWPIWGVSQIGYAIIGTATITAVPVETATADNAIVGTSTAG